MVYWGEHFLAVYGCWGGGSLLPHSAERQSSTSRGRYSRLRYRPFRSESDEPVKVERYCNGHPCVGVGASSWLEWSSGGDGGPSVPDQTLLDAQVPGGPAPALIRADQHVSTSSAPAPGEGAGADCVEPEKGSDGTRESVAQASRWVKTTAAITSGTMAQAVKTATACQCWRKAAVPACPHW